MKYDRSRMLKEINKIDTYIQVYNIDKYSTAIDLNNRFILSTEILLLIHHVSTIP